MDTVRESWQRIDAWIRALLLSPSIGKRKSLHYADTDTDSLRDASGANESHSYR